MILENEIFEEKDLLSGNCLMKCLKFLKIIDVIIIIINNNFVILKLKRLILHLLA
jgi:hypothetical protein